MEVIPTARQLAWQEKETYAIMHFTPTTFQNKEWGFGDADPGIFNPSHFNASAIAAAVKAGGFKGITGRCQTPRWFCTLAYKINNIDTWINHHSETAREI
jgi:alpha-L-fucosidase